MVLYASLFKISRSFRLNFSKLLILVGLNAALIIIDGHPPPLSRTHLQESTSSTMASFLEFFSSPSTPSRMYPPLLSSLSLRQGRAYSAALYFAVLVNLKHLYIILAPLFCVKLLQFAAADFSIRQFTRRVVGLVIIVAVVCAISLGSNPRG